MQLFRGYVETKNKKCIEKFKGRNDLKTFEEVQSLPEFAGILGEETILIDIDNFENSETIFKIVKELKLKCRVYETTRGKHFLFKNKGVKTNKTGCKLAIGLDSDIKLGSRNSYSILKFDNKDRKIIYDTPEDKIQELPIWLTPVNSSFDFLDMKVGDGRNQALFNYILTLQSNDFSVEEARETIRLINKYVLKVPLRDTELEVVLRDDAFKKPIFFKGTTFLFDKFATYIKNNNYIIRINNQLHFYKDGIYVDGYSEIEAEMIKHISNLNRAKRAEVLSYLNLLIRDNTPASDANLIAFRNGIYNIIDDSFVPFSPEIIITNRIPWDYNPAAYSEIVDNTLNKIACQDKQIRMLLEEAIGYCMYRRNELGKAFILIGDRSNGKSTFLDMVKTMLGDENELSKSYKGTPSDKGPFYHGTKADLKVGDLLTPGGISNYKPELKMNHIYFTANANGAGLAAALAKGEERERVYIIEPTGEFENDPNLTDKKFPGNLTRSYRSQEPLRIIGEETEWAKLTTTERHEWHEKLAKNKGEIIN